MKILFFLLLLCQTAGFCQSKVSGTVINKTTRQPISFVSIGIVGKTVGTVSSENGAFELVIPEKYRLDSICFAAIGYKPLLLTAVQLANRGDIVLEELPQQLEEVVVISKKLKYKQLGTVNYSKNNCTGFADLEGSWKGSEAAILIKNKKPVLMESFSFYVIQNKYPDSLLFRLMFYERIPGRRDGKTDEKQDWVGPTFLKKPVIFKVGPGPGEFTLPLRDYNIHYNKDFFISVECLVDEMDISKFCYSGSTTVQSYFKVRAFSTWRKTYGNGSRAGGGGGDFNVKVAYTD